MHVPANAVRLALPVDSRAWFVAQFKATRDELHQAWGEPHMTETDSTRTFGGDEDVWAWQLPSKQRLLIVLQVPYQNAMIMCDPPDLAAVVSVLGIERSARDLIALDEPILYPPHAADKLSTAAPRRRMFVALASGLVGAAVTAPLAVMEFQSRPRAKPPVPPAVKQLSPDEMGMITELCIVFFVVTYMVGETIYRRMGHVQDLRILKQLSGAHLPLLEFVGGAFLVGAPLIRANNQNPTVVWLLIAIGVVTIGHSTFRLIHSAKR